uniref:Neur_chan_LBD domain-containing protein n=1 Tax=Steinernema glaseri TaxID=37863 RepID=A0A1I7ZWJ2_9BILA
MPYFAGTPIGIDVHDWLPFLVQTGEASDDEERLMVDIFRGYNSLIQPVRNLSDIPITVKIALQLVLLINVDEKDQVMHTNVWLTLVSFLPRWLSYSLSQGSISLQRRLLP